VDVTEGGHAGCELSAFVAVYEGCKRLNNGKVEGGVMGDRNFRYDCGTLKFWAEMRRPFLWSPWSVLRSEVSLEPRLENCWHSE
jgi:hypothetical protein